MVTGQDNPVGGPYCGTQFECSVDTAPMAYLSCMSLSRRSRQMVKSDVPCRWNNAVAVAAEREGAAERSVSVSLSILLGELRKP